MFSASAQPDIAASRHAPGLALTTSDCLQSRGRLAVFPFAFRRGRPLGVDKWVKVLIALGARSPSAKSGSSLLVSGVDQSSEPPGWGGQGRVQTPSFPEEAWTLMRDVFCPDPASSPRVTPHRLLTESQDAKLRSPATGFTFHLHPLLPLGRPALLTPEQAREPPESLARVPVPSGGAGGAAVELPVWPPALHGLLPVFVY